MYNKISILNYLLGILLHLHVMYFKSVVKTPNTLLRLKLALGNSVHSLIHITLKI
jgi:hypothetical protein